MRGSEQVEHKPGDNEITNLSHIYSIIMAWYVKMKIKLSEWSGRRLASTMTLGANYRRGLKKTYVLSLHVFDPFDGLALRIDHQWPPEK